jgi:hypothetical protein
LETLIKVMAVLALLITLFNLYIIMKQKHNGNEVKWLNTSISIMVGVNTFVTTLVLIYM